MAKSCGKGKPCGAACVSSLKKCEVNLPIKTQGALDAVVDKILSHPQYLNTPEKAVAWLESHKDQLILSGIGDWGDKKGDLIVMGIEPAANPKGEYFDAKGKINPRLAKVKEEDSSNLAGEDWEKWYDKHPLMFANDIRQTLQVSKAIKKRGGNLLNPGQAAGVAMGKEGAKGKTAEGYSRESLESPGKKRPFIRNLISMSKGVKWNSLSGYNISPIGVPSDKYWPFSKLPFPPGSPFRSRDAWIKYSSEKISDKFKKNLSEHPRKMVMLGANRAEHQKMFKEIAKNMGAETKSKTLEWKSIKGNPMRATVSYFSVDGPMGKTVFLQTNHPSWPGWSEESLKSVSEIATEAQGLQN